MLTQSKQREICAILRNPSSELHEDKNYIILLKRKVRDFDQYVFISSPTGKGNIHYSHIVLVDNRYCGNEFAAERST